MWICDQWGITEDEVAKERRIRDYRWELTSNDHGSEPTIETLRTYAEWHAMFCAAEELLRTSPLEKDNWAEDTFLDWLLSHCTSYPKWWLADMRDPVPLDKIFWTMVPPDSADWETSIPENSFDPLVGFEHAKISEYVVLDAYIRRANEGYTETIHIASALASVETAPALLRALQTVRNPMDYRIPPEGDDLEIDKGDFRLLGWLKDIERPHDGIDMKDPLRNNLSGTLTLPGKRFSEWAKLISSPDNKLHWTYGEDQKAVTKFECWDDLPTTERNYRGFYSEGRRLWVHTPTLISFLKNEEKDLIVQCWISRWRDKKGAGEYVPGKAKIYLIHSDGIIETLR